MQYLDMLAKLGVGNAHPGGFTATLQQLRQFPISPGSKVLEIGCGTGRTACHLARQGCEVVAVDIRSEMLEKARLRAKQQQADVRFVQGDACSLPFQAQSFDVVFVESVTNFTEARLSLNEYFRVLNHDGVLYDREIMAWRTIPPKINRMISDFYGISRLHTPAEWTDLLRTAGFQQDMIWNMSPFTADMWKDAVLQPDPLQIADVDTFVNPEFWRLSMRYEEINDKYRKYFGFGVMIGRK